MSIIFIEIAVKTSFSLKSCFLHLFMLSVWTPPPSPFPLFRSTPLVPPFSTAPSRAGLPLSRPPQPCQPTPSGEVPRGLAWDSEHFMSLLPLPRPQARLSLQETRLSK